MIRQTLLTLAMAAGFGFAQEKVPVTMTVTVDAVRGREMPQLKPEDVMVYHGRQRLEVTAWNALQGEQSGLELYILIDDASGMSLGGELADLRRFIEAQPANALIGIAYMRGDSAEIAQGLTTDHPKASAALRLPFGRTATGGSPYLAFNDLLKNWGACCVRREVLIVSSGIDPLGGFGPENPFVDTAIGQAQRAGVVVFAIYTPRAGHSSHSFWQMNWGQNHLAQLAEETGGESYMLGYQAPVSFTPYLDDVSEHLKHQYTLTFLIDRPAKPGLVPIRLTTEVPGAEIIGASKVWVEMTAAGEAH